MPFTPFHFGPSACIALPLKRYIDFPTFMLANVTIDIEPLLVMVFDLSYPLHGFAHSFVGAAIVGIGLGVVANLAKGFIHRIMKNMLGLEYSSSIKQYLLSGMLGCEFHVLLDSPLYTDIKPFLPFSSINPFMGLIQDSFMYKMCAYAFIPAIVIYILILIMESNKRKA